MSNAGLEKPNDSQRFVTSEGRVIEYLSGERYYGVRLNYYRWTGASWQFDFFTEKLYYTTKVPVGVV
jgi:hypothetical protein